MRPFFTFLAIFASAAFAGQVLVAANNSPVPAEQNIARVDAPPVAKAQKSEKLASKDAFSGYNLSGHYLASQFAQQHHDWGSAESHLKQIIRHIPDDPDLLKRAMYLAMGSGNPEQAIESAKQLHDLEKDNALAMLFLAINAMEKHDYEQANTYIEVIPDKSLSKFVMDLLRSWSAASLGKNQTDNLNSNTIHVHHAILIADYLKDFKQVETLLKKALDNKEPMNEDLERIADIYAHIGKTDQAIAIYERIIKGLDGENNEEEIALIQNKIGDLKKGEKPSYFDPIEKPEHGVALALYDMAQLLYQEYSDENARVFAHMARYLNPELTDAKLILAEINARNDRLEEAIEFYLKVTPDSEHFIDSQHRAADLLEDSNRIPEALSLLEDLANTHNSVDSVIRIGDLHRRNEDYKKALVSYNKAVDIMGGEVPEKHWRLLYVRGMSNERAGNWNQAEKDLKAALAYKPDHPFIMNYLGYSWADKGIKLDESLALIERAVQLRPTDGYITDSLGWVYFKLGRYEEAVPYLEKAVELLPYDAVINDHLGDVYWLTGRRLEARFQWERARNNSEDETLISTLQEKIAQGLSEEAIKKASHESGDNFNP